ncbi:uncharacterized protein LOC120214372 [Hibiscus syriacus]|uniref:uncharacterized protein LOC120214372 n=1 Tax=Hibiscus syriacus TaxID=106335 RepID=UPI00192131CD|nr:uncharacterized protein LOC120214372 [Hibiscus syriacus]
MGVTMKRAALIFAGLGVLSFIFGVIAENKKSAAGTPIPGKDSVLCKYPSDPSVALGYLSVSFIILFSLAGYWSLFYPYKGKSVPQFVLFQSTGFFVFSNISLFTGEGGGKRGAGGEMKIWGDCGRSAIAPPSRLGGHQGSHAPRQFGAP